MVTIMEISVKQTLYMIMNKNRPMYKIPKHVGTILLVIILLISTFSSITLGITINKEKILEQTEDQSFKDFVFDLKMNLLTRSGQAISASMCIIKDDEIVWSNAYGWEKIWLWQKAKKDTIYLIGSVTKTITATALLQLYDQGYYDLDEDINNYLPFSLRNPNHPDIPITFRMILSHTSSIYDYCIYKPAGLLDFIRSRPYQDNVCEWIQEVLLPTGSLYKEDYWLKTAPGKKATYSSVGFLVAGALVEQISGKKIDEYCEQNIFEPMGMDNTDFDVSKLQRSQLATPYICRMGFHIPLPQYDPGCFVSMGGLRTTAEDLGHFLIAHMNNGRYKEFQLLKQETIEIMHNEIYEESINNASNLRMRYYGLGWFRCNWFGCETEGHGGMMPGGVAYMMTNTTDNTGFIMLTNHFDILGFFEPKLAIKFRCLNKVAELLLNKSKQY